MSASPCLKKKLALSGDSVDVLQPVSCGERPVLSPERASLCRTMAVFNGVFSILPGKLEAERAFAEETIGGGASFEEFQKRRGRLRDLVGAAHTRRQRLRRDLVRRPRLRAGHRGGHVGSVGVLLLCSRGQVKKLSAIELEPAQPLRGAPEAPGRWRA